MRKKNRAINKYQFQVVSGYRYISRPWLLKNFQDEYLELKGKFHFNEWTDKKFYIRNGKYKKNQMINQNN